MNHQLNIRRQLLSWYDVHARDLPWRDEIDPYRVWISEVMLQQTRVETVIPYYQRWLEKFPTLNHLAQTDEQDVLKAWEGLGYYSRARNLLKAARIIQNELSGKFPRELIKLKKLPGVGDYIAGAVASIAFGTKTPALDGNGKRVLSRLYAFREPVNQGKSARILENYLMELLPDKRAGDLNQAIMDLGSRICLTRRPRCGECPLQSLCESYRQGAQLEIPVRTSKRPVPHYQVVAAVIRDRNIVLIDKRRSGDLLGGMWEFPGGKVERGENLADALVREIREELGLEIHAGKLLNVYDHAYTHFSVEVHAIECEIVAGKPQALEADAIAWVPINRLEDYPMGKVDRLISRDLLSTH